MHMEILTSISMSTEEKVSMLRSPSLILGFWFSPLLVWSNALTSSSHSLQRVQQLSLWCSCSTHHSVPPAESQDSWCVWDGHVVTYVVNWLGVFEERKTVLLHKTTLHILWTSALPADCVPCVCIQPKEEKSKTTGTVSDWSFSSL